MSFPVEKQLSLTNGDSSCTPPFCSAVHSPLDSLVHLFLRATKMMLVPEPCAGLAGGRERETERVGERDKRESMSLQPPGVCSTWERSQKLINATVRIAMKDGGKT